MKKRILIILSFFALTNFLFAQFQSVRDGDWDYPGTWSNDPDATAIPDSTDDVIVNHEINIDCCGGCRNLTINSGGRVHNGNIRVYGSLNNSGTINGRDEWYGMKISLRGNLTNTGYYDADTDFEGSSDQEVFAADTIRFGQSYDRNSASKIIFTNKALISDSWMFLENSELVFYDTLKYKHTVLDGGIINGNGNVLYGVPNNENLIGWIGATSFGPKYTELKNLKFAGYNGLSGGGNVGDDYALGIGADVSNEGVIINSYLHTGGRATIHILNDFVNNGIIYEQQDGIFFKINNSRFINNGSLAVTSLEFNGTCEFTTQDSVALGAFNALDSNTTVTVTDGDVFFKDRTVYMDFNGGTLNLHPNSKFYTTFMWYNKLKNITLNANNSEIIFAHSEENVVITNPKIKYLEESSNLLLVGNVEIISGGTLIAYADCFPTVTIEGDLKNYGSVRNHYTHGNLRLEVTGNILHDGNRWDNYETKLIGTQDQSILIPNDSAWLGKVVLEAMLTGASYQWQKDGSDIAGANSAQLIFASGLNSSDYGNYQCIVDGTPSRNIFIGNALPDAFEIYDVTMKTVDSTSTMIFWKTSVPAKGFIFYAENDASNGYPLEAEETGDFTTEHCITLSNLNYGSTYYFIIDQNDAGYVHNVRSDEFNFIAGDFTLGALILNFITDVPEDQGGWVYVNFDADILDATGSIKFYGVYEYMNEEWVSLGSVPATQDSEYTFLAHTYKDSSNEGNYWSKFYITAHTNDPYVYFISAVDSGYSIDNLAPQAPEGLIPFMPESGEYIQLVWNRNSEEDVDYYCVYKNGERYATLIDTTFIDSSITDGEYEYKITAVDFHGNESEFSESVSIIVGVGEEEDLPTKFELTQNYPNPFNPTTTIKYSIIKTVRVTLKVYDILGKEVATLVNEMQSTGNYKVTFDATKLSSGIYFYSLKAGKFVAVKKMILIK